MTVEELEGKLTSIYHEFAETISENETDEQIVARSKEWFVKRLSEETDNKEAIESIANQLVGCLKQASRLGTLCGRLPILVLENTSRLLVLLGPMFWNLYGRKNDFIFREEICLLQGWNSISETSYHFRVL